MNKLYDTFLILNILVFVFSCFMKLPQLYTILARERVDNLSFVMFYIECLCYITSAFYGFIFKQNFFVYGHNITLFIQTFLISLCFVKFHNDESHRIAYKRCLLCLFPLCVTFLFIPKRLLDWIELSTSFFNIFSRYPQIDYCYWNKTTDNLNWIPIALSIIGNVINICGYYYIANASIPQIVVAVIVIILDAILLVLIYKYGDNNTSPNFKFVISIYVKLIREYIDDCRDFYYSCCLNSRPPPKKRYQNEINLSYFPDDNNNNTILNHTPAKKSDNILSLSSSSSAIIDDDAFNSAFGSDVISNKR